nr:MAG TPA: helix-turn-helix domain protein [Caudoviricetes sp.]
MNLEKIKNLMSAQKVTQAELASVAGTSQAFISYVMDGTKMPSVAVLKRIADRLGVTMDELVRD